MSSELPVIAIIGRPNVGKSTLFNRLAGRRIAIVSDIPGTTRDRVSIDAEWAGRRYLLIDTGGIEERPGDTLWDEVRIQTGRAVEQADALMLVVDATEGIHPNDQDAADIARRSGKPCVLVANKADNLLRESSSGEFYELGMGDPLPVSAYHNRGVSDLMDAVFSHFPFEGWGLRDPLSIRIAIVGRPNVGKSALFNSLTGEERAIVSPTPGTTRDSIDSRFTYEGRDLTFLDTAGLRRRGRAEQGIEKYSAIRTIGAVERSHVCLLLMDASEFVTAQDTHIGGYIDDAARAAIVVVNKWDMARELGLDRDEAEKTIRGRFKYFPEVPVLFTSALTGAGVRKLPGAAVAAYERFTTRVKREDLSRVVFDAIGQNAPPSQGTVRPRIFRVSQTRTGPPTFVFTARSPELIHFSYRRYLENRLRDAFGFEGIPMRLQFIARDE